PVWDYRSPLALLRIIAEPSPFRVKSARAQLLWCLYPCKASRNQLKPPRPRASTPELPSLPDFNARACHLLGSHQVVGHGENNCALPLNPEKASRNEARATKPIPILLQKVVGGEDPAVFEFRHQRIADILIVMTLTSDHGRVRRIGIVAENEVGAPGRASVLADD